MKRKNAILKSYWLVYFIGFLIFTLMAFHWFWGYGKSLVWKEDGQKQHLVALMYYSNWLKTIINHLIHDHRLCVPLWDMTIGYGSDIIGTLHYYVLGDPLNLISVFVPHRFMEQLYDGLIIVRLFLAGAAFSAYSLSLGNGKKASLIGAYMYAFSGFMLYFSVRHPYFANPLIYMPLMLLGVEKLFKKQKPYLFIFSTAVAAMSNFYFCYMLIIFIVMYVLLRYKSTVGDFRPVMIAGWLARFAACGCLALLLASVIFVPICAVALGLGRMGVHNYIPLVFQPGYYQNLLAGFSSGVDIGYSNKFSVAVPALLALLLMIVTKGNGELKAGLILLLVIFMLPYAGHVMNGFSYVTYRCSFAMSFLLSYVFVKMFRVFEEITKKEKNRVTIGVLVYYGLLLLFEDTRTETTLCMGILTFGCLCLVWCSDVVKSKGNYFFSIFYTFTLLSIGFSAYYLYSPQQEDYVSEFIDRQHATGNISSKYGMHGKKGFFHASNLILKNVDEHELARAEIYAGNEDTINSAMIQRYYGSGFYFSMNSPYVAQFSREMCLPYHTEFYYENLDCRNYLEALTNIRYFVMPGEKGAQCTISYLFHDREPVARGASYNLYQANNSIGFAYGYDRYFTREQYDAANAAQKQEMLLQGALVEDKTKVKNYSDGVPDFLSREKGYTLELGENVTKVDNQFYVAKKGAGLTLYFDGDTDCETYVLLQGLKYQGMTKWDRTSQDNKDDMSLYERMDLKRASVYWNEPTQSYITVSTNVGKGGRGFLYKNYKNAFYCGLSDFMCNLGFSKEAPSYVSILFEKTGVYTLDSVSIFSQPMDRLEQLMDQRKLEGGDDFVIDTNTFDGTVMLDVPEIVCFSIPYSTGWRAYVDGKERELIRVNTMFMAIPLESGRHDIHLEYCTPYLKYGVLGTSLGLLIMGGMYIYGIFFKKQISL